MSIQKKRAHNAWIEKFVEKGGKKCEYICGHCDNPVEIPIPTKEQVSGKGYWDGVKECPDCEGHNFVKTWPSGHVEVEILD
jgi:DNA-directed RNA polymerase subunit RPC12/RpoP